MPIPQVFLHPPFNIGAVHALNIFPLLPCTAVEHAQVEVASSKVPLQGVCDFEALSFVRASFRCLFIQARANPASIAAFDYSFGFFVDIPEGHVATHIIDLAISGIKVKEVSISALAICFLAEPCCRPGVLFVIAVSYIFVGFADGAFFIEFPAFSTVDVGYLACFAPLRYVGGKFLA